MNFAETITRSPFIQKRLLGLQANTSAKSPEELDGLGQLDGAEPQTMAAALLALHLKFGIKVIGGCCGRITVISTPLPQGFTAGTRAAKGMIP